METAPNIRLCIKLVGYLKNIYSLHVHKSWAKVQNFQNPELLKLKS